MPCGLNTKSATSARMSLVGKWTSFPEWLRGIGARVVARGRMDSLCSPFGRTACVCRRCAARLNCRHADFQNAGGSPGTIFFSKLPGRPLLRLQQCA